MRSADTEAARDPTPIFLFSLPRAGSTLLQRLITSNPGVASSREPWLLLAPFFARREEGAVTAYGQRTAARALADVAARLPDGEEVFTRATREYAMTVYTALAKGRPFYLDKTPRYHLIVDEILQAFPEGRFVFLWRHPLAVPASMIETFGAGRWVLHRFEEDLFGGLERLISAYERCRTRAYALQYEALVANPVETLGPMFRHLGLTGHEMALETFGDVDLGPGRMGDPTGSMRYNAISNQPNTKWMETMANPLRKAWSRSYLEWIGRERCAVMGYDLDELLTSLERLTASPRRLCSDVVFRAYGFGYRHIGSRLFGAT